MFQIGKFLIIIHFLISPIFFSCHITRKEEPDQPNFIIIFCDDLGYGDIGPFGSKINRTPNLDRMALEGMKLTSFYTSASVCTPSRASLLTGCYPQRIDMAEMRTTGFRSVLLPGAAKGLNPEELTIEEILKEAGYTTACIGKWHVGDQPPFLPTRQGFDEYFGIPYSNDMDGQSGVPLMRNEEVIEQPVNQNTITLRYTEEAISFIDRNQKNPFFLYLPHTMPHAPLHASDRFRGHSEYGIYSDAIEEIDWSTGKILAYLKEKELERTTLVFFTSDNGGEPRFGGNNTPLRGGKGTTWEGGMRVPAIAWWPGQIPANSTTDALSSIMDLLPTIYGIVYQHPFQKSLIDGHDIWPLLNGMHTNSPYQAFFYYDRDQLQAVRAGKWKLHLPLENRFKAHYTDESFTIGPKLYNLEEDISESQNLFQENPEIADSLMHFADQARKVLGDTDLRTPYIRSAGQVAETYYLKKIN